MLDKDHLERMTLTPVHGKYSILTKEKYVPKYYIDFTRREIEELRRPEIPSVVYGKDPFDSNLTIEKIRYVVRTYRSPELMNAVEVIKLFEKTGYILYPSQIDVITTGENYQYSMFTRVPNEKEKLELKLGDLAE